MPPDDDHYRVLGVAPDATADEIKSAFRALAKECHPDVAGDDPDRVDRFKRARAAYEVLGDPSQRARYDRRRERRPGGGHFGSHWRNAGTPVNGGGAPPAGNPGGLDLEDIFNDFGGPDFGFGGRQQAHVRMRAQVPPGAAGPGAAPRAPRPPRPEAKPAPERGRDVQVDVEVPADVAARGGTVEVRYVRRRRGDDGVSLFRYDEIHDLRVPPGTSNGSTLVVEKAGNAGPSGGPYGDLCCRVTVAREPISPPQGPHAGEILPCPIGIAEALLGGRVVVETPAGRVRVSIPPGTSSGARMRLRGKGREGADGTRGDVVAEVRIVVPRELDAESRALIERFAELNPAAGEDG